MYASVGSPRDVYGECPESWARRHPGEHFPRDGANKQPRWVYGADFDSDVDPLWTFFLGCVFASSIWVVAG